MTYIFLSFFQPSLPLTSLQLEVVLLKSSSLASMPEKNKVMTLNSFQIKYRIILSKKHSLLWHCVPSAWQLRL